MTDHVCKCCIECYEGMCFECKGYCACAKRDHAGCGSDICNV